MARLGWSALAAWRAPLNRSRALTFVLAALWMWNAAAYHAWLFTRINPAAWLFAVLFAIEAGLLTRVGFQGVEYCSSTGWTRIVGGGLAVYGLAYPFLAMTLVHRYPATPTFGVPCPTALLTIGVLLTARKRAPVWLAVIPALWGLIGGSAALLLGVPTDYVLIAAGVLQAVVLLAPRLTPSPMRRPISRAVVDSPRLPADRLRS